MPSYFYVSVAPHIPMDKQHIDVVEELAHVLCHVGWTIVFLTTPLDNFCITSLGLLSSGPP